MPQNLEINLKQLIIPKYKPVLQDILKHKHSRYIFKGGRGSTKSSLVSEAIPLIIINYPNVNAVCFRQVANTIQNSVFSQVVWAIYKMGLQALFHIPKTYGTPITYMPTGQKILFMGLDDPMKVKSIKVDIGYIGITWFEEMDQYKGENALRKVTQSTKRGGELFWDFRTFNPPISKNNWANEYVDDILFRNPANTLVVHNSYLDVPPQWLGQEFLDEAEELKQKNPRAYQHEYMGEAIGTGGDVFPNVCEFDSDASYEIKDASGAVIQKIPYMSLFDNVYNGLDWGFAIDPLRFVKMHFDRARYDLYIYREFNAVKMVNRVAFDELYNVQKLVTKDELLTADSAEPKSIMDFKAWGAYIRGAEKGPDSVRYGIKWLQGLNHIYIDRKYCPETYTEFSTYEYEKDKDDNWISAYPDENNHSIDAVRYGLEKFYNRKGN